MVSERPLGRDGQPIPTAIAAVEPIEDLVDRIFEANLSPGQEARDMLVMDAAEAVGSSGVPAVVDVAGELVDWSQSDLPWDQLPQSYRDEVQVMVREKHARAMANRSAASKAWEKRVRDLEKLPLDHRSRIDLRVSPEFKAWVRDFSDHMGASITVLICSSLVAQARASGYHKAVPARFNRRDETPDIDAGPASGPTRIALEVIEPAC